MAKYGPLMAIAAFALVFYALNTQRTSSAVLDTRPGMQVQRENVDLVRLSASTVVYRLSAKADVPGL